MDEKLDQVVDHLIKTAVSEITEKLPEIVKSLVHQQLEQVFKTEENILNELGDIRKDLNGFDKRISDQHIVLDTIDSRTQQIKISQDKTPDEAKKDMQKAVENSVNSAVETAVPAAMLSVVEPKKHAFAIIQKRGFFAKLKLWR